MCLYWGVGSIYILMDYFNLPKWIRKYKVQPGTNEPVDTKRLISVSFFSDCLLSVKHSVYQKYSIPSTYDWRTI